MVVAIRLLLSLNRHFVTFVPGPYWIDPDMGCHKNAFLADCDFKEKRTCVKHVENKPVCFYFTNTREKKRWDDRENVLFLNKTYFVKVFLEYRITKCYGIGLNKA